MKFNELINEIMPLVNDASEKPCVVWRDGNSEWNLEIVKSLNKIKEQDPLAIAFSGKDYAGASQAFVFDKVLATRFRAEYETTPISSSNLHELNVLVNFMEDNMGAFSNDTLEYISQYDRPLAALNDMIPMNLKYKTQEAVEIIENNIQNLIHRPKDEEKNNKFEKSNIEGYEEKFSVQLAGQSVVLAENPNVADSYLVCNIHNNNLLGIEERLNGAVTDNFLEAMREFINRADGLLSKLENERIESGLPFQMLSSNDCIQSNQKADWVNKVVIVKAENLSPEYRSAEHQLVLCTGGFGASANARGNAVFVKELHSGKECQYDRHQISGVADPSKMPNWAIDKLMEVQKEREARPLTQNAQKKKPTLQEKLDHAKEKAKDAMPKKDIADKPKERGRGMD